MTARQLAQADKKRRRALRERQLGKKQRAMPTKLYGVIYADPSNTHPPCRRSA
jgi:hypothetical protein